METPAARIARTCLLLRARRLARATTAIYTASLEHHGLSVGQFTLLAAIGANPGVRASDLGPALDLDRSTISRELAALVDAGLVTSEPVDGRSSALRATDEGQARLAAALPDWEEAQVAARDALGPLADALLDHFSEP